MGVNRDKRQESFWEPDFSVLVNLGYFLVFLVERVHQPCLNDSITDALPGILGQRGRFLTCSFSNHKKHSGQNFACPTKTKWRKLFSFV